MSRLLAQLALIVVGLGALVWALTLAGHPTIMCRDSVMGPGDVCPNAQGTATQTYEARLARSLEARPIVAVVGAALTGFGVALALQGRRQASSDIGP